MYLWYFTQLKDIAQMPHELFFHRFGTDYAQILDQATRVTPMFSIDIRYLLSGFQDSETVLRWLELHFRLGRTGLGISMPTEDPTIRVVRSTPLLDHGTASGLETTPPIEVPVRDLTSDTLVRRRRGLRELFSTYYDVQDGDHHPMDALAPVIADKIKTIRDFDRQLWFGELITGEKGRISPHGKSAIDTTVQTFLAK